MQWLGLLVGAALVAAAVFYFIVGFFPASSVSQSMRSRLELSADIRTAKGYAVNTAALYAWILRTKPRVTILGLFLLFWGGWFMAASVRT
jgi:hypothetical protein